MRDALDVLDAARAVIFDCDDTVIATAKSRWDVLIATAGTFGVALTEERIRGAWGLPFDSLIRALVPTIGHDDYVRRYRAAMLRTAAEPCAGAAELLRQLSARAVTMEIVSSSSRDLIMQDLKQLELDRYFERVYGQEQTGVHKPDPKVLYVVIGDLLERGFQPNDLVYIGDSVRDYTVAAGNDIEFIAVLSGLESREELNAAGVPNERIVDELTELLGHRPRHVD